MRRYRNEIVTFKLIFFFINNQRYNREFINNLWCYWWEKRVISYIKNLFNIKTFLKNLIINVSFKENN